jgi:hypothetical protein
MPLQIRRGTEAERQVLASPPQQGELIWISDDKKLYIGDGATLAKDLDPITGFNTEDAIDAIGAVFRDTSHNGLTFAFNDSANTITGTVELDQFRQNVDMAGFTLNGSGNIDIIGNVNASSFTGDYKGSIFADDSTVLVNASEGTINLYSTIGNHIVPKLPEAYDIGSVANPFRDIYLSGSSIHLGNALITATGTAVNLPAGSTIGGAPLDSGGPGASLNIDIVGDDSTVIVNTSTNTVTGTFDGDLHGSVFADNSTMLVDGTNGTVVLNNGTVSITGNTIDLAVGETLLKLGETTDVGPSPTFRVTNVDYSPPFEALTLGGTSIIDTSKFVFSTHHGSMTSPTAPNAGEYMGGFSAQAYEPTSAGYVPAMIIGMQIDNNETVAADQIKGKLVVTTNGGTGSAPILKYMTFDARGRLAVNQANANDDCTLDVNGIARLAPVSAAPAVPVEGMIAIADGAGWDPSGSNPTKKQMVVYLGTAWVQIAIQA